jgi:hypothetical protein
MFAPDALGAFGMGAGQGLGTLINAQGFQECALRRRAGDRQPGFNRQRLEGGEIDMGGEVGFAGSG